jgi:hypothetical protein
MPPASRGACKRLLVGPPRELLHRLVCRQSPACTGASPWLLMLPPSAKNRQARQPPTCRMFSTCRETLMGGLFLELYPTKSMSQVILPSAAREQCGGGGRRRLAALSISGHAPSVQPAAPASTSRL